MQLASRAFLARREARERRRRRAASVALQCLFRSRRTRADVLELKRQAAATRLAAWRRGLGPWGALKRAVAAAVALQCWARGRGALVVFALRKKAAKDLGSIQQVSSRRIFTSTLSLKKTTKK